MTTLNSAPDLIDRERDGEQLTGVRTGIRANSFTIRQLSARKRQSGWIVRDSQVHDWKPRGLMEHDGQIYVTGPRIGGMFFERALSDPDRDHLHDIATLAQALSQLPQSEVEALNVHTRMAVILDDGGVLIIPPEINATIIDNADVDARTHMRERFTHPDKTGLENLSFFIAATTYRVITGHDPFAGKDAEELHARIRAGKAIPAHLRCFELKQQISETLSEHLVGEKMMSPGDWAFTLRNWRSDGMLTELTAEARSRIEEQARDTIERMDKAFGRSETVRRNWRKWAIIAAVSAIVLTVPGTILRNALQPRATAGFTPAEVVQAFYWSINSLDHMTMEDAVVDGAGRGFIREVTNLFVIDRQRMSVEMKSGFVDARDWDAQGRPDLEADRSPYGLTLLSLEELPAPSEERAFRATYERWLPNTEGSVDGPPDPRYVGLRATDELKLRLDGDDWVIYEITAVSSKELAPAP